MRRNDATRRHPLRTGSAWRSRPGLERMEDRVLLATFTVNTADDPVIRDPADSVVSLREAIERSNAANTGTPNIINFRIAAASAGVQTITPAAINGPLPVITAPVTIDGSTEVGSAGAIGIQLNGASAGSGANGFTVSAGNTTIRGFAINRFSAEGISLTTAGGNTIASNYIGTNATGSSAAGNALDGILIGAGSNNNVIRNNLIAGNLANGIYLDGTIGGSDTTTTTGNTIVGNRIGLTALGNALVANGGDGIRLVSAPNTTIGGTTAATRNVISGNANGLELFGNSDGTVVQGNFIGTDITGTAPLGNGASTTGNGFGIALQGISNSRIGGTAAGAGNVISGNNNAAIGAPGGGGSTAITIQGNLIGVDASGVGQLSNAAGINVSGISNVLIGGTAAGAGNVIATNQSNGITATFGATGLVIQGNFIGTDASRTLALGNAGAGIAISNVNGVVIGATPDAPGGGGGNVIANNGVTVAGAGTGAGAGISLVNSQTSPILSNSIYNNLVGIDLNIVRDFFGNPITFSNNAQAAPVLTSAVSNLNFATSVSSSTFTGVLPGALENDSYTLQFFTNLGPDRSGNFEGETFVGSATVTVGLGGVFTANLPVGFTAGTMVTATATDENRNTSAFSAPVMGTGFGPLNRLPVVSVQSSATAVASGERVTFVFTITNDSQVEDTGVAFYAPIPLGTTFASGVAVASRFDSTTGTNVPTALPVVVTGGVANAAIGRIAAGESATVTLVLTTGGAAVPAFTLTGGITSTVPTITPGIAQASATVAVAASDDLYTFVNGPLTPVQVGQNITYEVTVGNNGPSAATGVVLSNILPAGTTLVSATTSNGTVPTLAGNTLTGALGTVASGATVVVTVVVATNGGTPQSPTNVASVTGDQPDSDPTNNVGFFTNAIIPSADVAITAEAASPGAVQAGQLVSYTFNLANFGPSPATGVVLRDTLPAGSTFVTGSAPGGAVSVADGVVTAPVGTLAAGGTAVVTILVRIGSAGLVSDSAVISSDDLDPNPTNNASSATVAVSPLTDLAVGLLLPTTAATTGAPYTYTAVITNTGPSAATGVILADTLPAGATFLSATVGGVAVGSAAGGNIVVPVGTVGSGQTVTVSITILPTVAGTLSSTATVAAIEPDANAANNTSTATFVAAAPLFYINFTGPTYLTSENAGFARITLVRVGDPSSAVTVRLSTVPGGNARPGVDYLPVSTVVSFAPDQVEATVDIPVLPNPNDSLDEYVNLQLDSPTGGASLFGGGSQLNAVLRIVNTDPLLVGPTVTDFKLIGPAGAITSIEVDTTGRLDPATVGNAANYRIVAVGGGTGRNRLPAGTVVAVAAVAYNAQTGTITLTPSTPLPAGQLFEIVVNGSTPGGITDLAGNPLNSVVGTTPGGNFDLTFQRGTTITYRDENNRRVTLRLTGGGTLDINRASNGVLQRLQVVGATRNTALSGSVAGAPPRRTTIGSVIGLRRFGTVRTSLPSPPFFVTNTIYPNLQSLNNGDAVDTLLPTPRPGRRPAVSARTLATTTGAAHPRANAAHAKLGPKAAAHKAGR